jgi:polyvinyl alcohol dehydrogenase (cytochrome)
MRATPAAFLATLALGAAAAPATADWPIYGRDLVNSRNAGSDGPAPAQIPTLKEAWSFDSPTGDFTGTPVVAKGVLVAGDYGGVVYALDAVTGKVLWTRKLHDPVNGSAAIDAAAPNGGAVYVPVARVGAPRITALSLRDGRPRWSSVLTKQPESSMYGSPTYWHGTVYAGTSGPNGDGSHARGAVVALDARTGALRWRTYAVPPKHDGGAVWSTPAIDTKTGRLYVGTGNAYHDPAADTTDAVIALDAASGKILGHFQAVSDDIFGPDNPAGPDADFGASPNLLEGPGGQQLVGEGAKDGFYYALDRATLNFVWKTALGPGSAIGGFVGSTAYDGTRIYGANTLTSQVGALGRDGVMQWTSVDGGSAHFSPVAIANGVLYSVNQSGMLAARDAKTGNVITQVSLGGPTFGGISTVGRAVYAAVGVGPPPAPAPQNDGTGSIVALGDTSQSGPAGRKARMRVSLHPRRVRAGRRVRFHFRVTSVAGTPIRGARIRFAHALVRTGRDGRATIVARFAHPGKRRARVRAKDYATRRVVVRVRPGER